MSTPRAEKGGACLLVSKGILITDRSTNKSSGLRYNMRGPVWIVFDFFLSCAINTLRYWDSFSCDGPHTWVSRYRCVRTFPSLRANIANNYSVAVSLMGVSSFITVRLTKSIDKPLKFAVGILGSLDAFRRAERMSNSPVRKGFVK